MFKLQNIDSIRRCDVSSESYVKKEGGSRSVVSRPARYAGNQIRRPPARRDSRSHRTARSYSCDCVTRQRCWTNVTDAALYVVQQTQRSSFTLPPSLSGTKASDPTELNTAKNGY